MTWTFYILPYSGKLSREKTFPDWLLVLPPKDVTPSNFMEKTFKNSNKTSKFMKVFSLITGYRPFHHPKDNSRQIFQAIQQVFILRTRDSGFGQLHSCLQMLGLHPKDQDLSCLPFASTMVTRANCCSTATKARPNCLENTSTSTVASLTSRTPSE